MLLPNSKNSLMIVLTSSTNVLSPIRMVFLLKCVIRLIYRVHEDLIGLCNGFPSYWVHWLHNKARLYPHQQHHPWFMMKSEI